MSYNPRENFEQIKAMGNDPHRRRMLICPKCGNEDDTGRVQYRYGPHETDVHCQNCGHVWDLLRFSLDD